MEKFLHQIWVGPYPLPAREAALVEGIRAGLAANNPDWTHKLWTNDNLPVLPPGIQECWDAFGRSGEYAFQSDILRTYLVYEYGGLYLDTDCRWVNGICDLPLESLDGFYVGHWGTDYTMANCCFGAARRSPTITYLYEDLHPPCGWFGPGWQGATLKRMYGLPNVTDHDSLKLTLAQDNVLYFRYSDFCREYFHHGMHYTWCAENKKRLAEGTYR